MGKSKNRKKNDDESSNLEVGRINSNIEAEENKC